MTMQRKTLTALTACAALSCGGGQRVAADDPTNETGSAQASRLLAPTPPMGFNNWNAFGCDVSETLIKETADFFVSSGLKDAGYEFVNIDDCWSSMQRDAEGRLTADPVKFPSGISGVADYVHALGLKLGIYGDAGTRTCAGYPGSLGNEALDAQTFASWGVDYLKYDNCYNQSDGSREDFVRRYTAMRDALDAVDRPIVYSICEWGQSQPWEWATNVGDLWRTTGDITDTWSSIRDIIALNIPLAEYAGPGHWNDPDMLEIGNGTLSTIEKQTHMGMWSMMAAPLIIGTDLRVATDETLAILENRQLIAINQDPLGEQARLIADDGGRMVLRKRLQNGDHAIALYNATNAQAVVRASVESLELEAADAYFLHDVWTDTSFETREQVAMGVPAHGTVVLRARPLQPSDLAAPALSIEGSLATLIPGVAEPTPVTARITNHGAATATALRVELEAPEGWSVSAATETQSDQLTADAVLEAGWSLRVPEGTQAGLYPVAVRVDYGFREGSTASIATELVGAVAVPPPAGSTPLSTLRAMSTSNGLGPVEVDASNGQAAEGDGNLITVGGKVYTRGFGTQAPSSITHYLGGDCSRLSVEVGVDDEVGDAGSVSFSILADGRVVAETGVLTGSDAPLALEADLTGATTLELAVNSGDAPLDDHADWANPIITCGDSTQPTVVERTLFSFESGTEELTVANAAEGGSFELSDAFATNGVGGLSVTSPADGNWFGRRFDEPLDLSAYSSLRFDMKTTAAGGVGEFALEMGAGSTWCQGSLWTWTEPNSSKTIVRSFDQIACPGEAVVDTSQIRAVWIYLKDGTFLVDNVRAE